MRDSLLLTLLGGTLAWNTDQSCSPAVCTESPLGLDANTRYELTYHSAVHTSGSNPNDGIVQEVNAFVAVQTGANACQLQLEVTDVDSLSNVETALRFSMEDGVIKNICPSDDETQESLNLKKSILSMLQVQYSGNDYLEEDIYGKCITNYEQSGLEFRKTRDLTQCSSSNQNALIFGRLGSMSSAMSGSLNCVAREGLKKVSCSETRKIAQPFDQSEDLFSTFIQSNLVLKSTASNYRLEEYSHDKVTSLKLDLTSNDLTADLYSDAENILKDICSVRASINDFGDVPRHIKSLMVTMEQLQSSDLMNLWSMAESACSEARETIEQCLSWCSTGNCLEASSLMALKSAPEQAQQWVQQIAVNAPPSEKLVDIVYAFLTNQNLPIDSELGLVVHRYCKSVNDCDKSLSVIKALTVMNRRVTEACEDSKSDLTEKLLGLENARSINPVTFTTCSMSNNLGNENFVQIMRAASGQKSCQELLPVMFDIFVSSETYTIETRAAAYLNMLNCISSDYLTKIESAYQNLESLQMQHFVYSHITQMQYTLDPLKSIIKQFSSRISLNPPVDYHNNQHYSKYWDVTMPLGYHAVTAGGYVIFERESPLPRALHAGITLSFYEEPIEVLDLHVRQENIMKIANKMTNKKFDESDQNDVAVDHSVGTFETDYAEAKLDLSLKMMGVSVVSTTFDEKTLEDLVSGHNIWETFKEKFMNYQFVDAFRSLIDSFKSSSDMGLNKNIILGFYEIKLPNLIGQTISFQFDLLGSTSFDFETDGIGLSGISGSVTPKAVLELASEFKISGLDQGLRTRTNVNTATTNSIRFSFATNNYELRIETPEEQNIISIEQEIEIVTSKDFSEMLQTNAWGGDCGSKTVSGFGHEFSYTCKGSNQFMKLPFQMNVAIRKTDPTMSHFVAQLAQNDDVDYMLTLGFPNARDNFLFKAWYDETNGEVYNSGLIFKPSSQTENLLNEMHVELELNVPRRELKARYSDDDSNSYKLHGRFEENRDGSVNALVVMESPTRKLEVLSLYRNDDDAMSIAFDIQGKNFQPKALPKIHVDLTLQKAEPQFAMNLQLAEYTFKTEAAYQVEPIRDGLNHTINYIIMIPKHQMRGTTEFLNMKNEWSLRSSLLSDLLPQRKPLILSTYYKLEQSATTKNVILAIPVFRIPGIIEVTDTSMAAKHNENDLELNFESKYHFIMSEDSVRETIDAEFNFQKRPNSVHLEYNFAASEFPEYDQVFEIAHQRAWSNDSLKRMMSSVHVQWGDDMSNLNKQISMHQVFQYNTKKNQDKYFLGMNGTFLGEGMKLYSDIQQQNKVSKLDIRMKFAKLDELETSDYAQVLFKLEQLFKSKNRVELMANVNIPFYFIEPVTFVTSVPRFIEKNGFKTNFKFRFGELKPNFFDYSVGVLLPIEMEGGDALEAVLRGKLTLPMENRPITFESLNSVQYMKQEIFKFSTSVKESGDKKKAMAELIYPHGGQAIISQFKFNLISDGHVGSKFDMSGGFNTNHPSVEQYNRTTFFTRFVPQNGFKFNSGVRLSETKKVEMALGYDDSDSSIEIDLRQTLDESGASPAVISGSGRYDEKDSQIVIDLNHDKNYVRTSISFAPGVYRFDLINGDAFLLKASAPQKITALVGFDLNEEGSLNGPARVQFNSSWTMNRDFGVLAAYDDSEENVVIYAEIHNNAFDGMPGKIVTTFKAEDINQPGADSKSVTYDIAIDDRHALSASAVYDETPSAEYTTTTLEFTNDLIEGPYQASAMLSQSNVNDEFGKITIQWENEYRGNTPCEIQLARDSNPFVSVGFKCNDPGNNKNIEFKLSEMNLDLKYEDFDNHKHLILVIDDEVDDNEDNIKLSVDLEDGIETPTPLLSQFTSNWNTDDINPRLFTLGLSFDHYEEQGGHLQVTPLRLEWTIPELGHWEAEGDMFLTLKQIEALDSEEQFEYLPAQLMFNIDIEKSEMSVKTSSKNKELDMEQLSLAYSLNDDNFKLELKSPIASNRKMYIKFAHQLSNGVDAYSFEENDHLNIQFIDMHTNELEDEIEIKLDCQIYDCRFSSRFNFEDEPILLNVMYSLEGDITSNTGEPIESLDAMPDWRAIAKVKFTGRGKELNASEELSLNSVGSGYRFIQNLLKWKFNGSAKAFKQGLYLTETDESYRVALQSFSTVPKSPEQLKISREFEPFLNLKDIEVSFTHTYAGEFKLSQNIIMFTEPSDWSDKDNTMTLSVGGWRSNAFKIELLERAKPDRSRRDIDQSSDTIQHAIFQLTHALIGNEFAMKILVDGPAKIDLLVETAGFNPLFRATIRQAKTSDKPLKALLMSSLEDENCCLYSEDCEVHFELSYNDEVDSSTFKAEFENTIGFEERVAAYLQANFNYNQFGQTLLIELNENRDVFEYEQELYQFGFTNTMENTGDGDLVNFDISGKVNDPRIGKPFDFILPRVKYQIYDGMLNRLHTELKLSDSKIAVVYKEKGEAKISKFSIDKISSFVDDRLVLESFDFGVAFTDTEGEIEIELEGVEFEIEAKFDPNEEFSASFGKRERQLNQKTVLGSFIDKNVINSIPDKSELGFSYNLNMPEDHFENIEADFRFNLRGGTYLQNNFDTDKLGVETGFKISAPVSHVFFNQKFDNALPQEFSIGYKYTPATLQTPMNFDIIFAVGEEEQKVETKLGMNLVTEGSPSAEIHFEMSQYVDILKQFDWLPNELDVTNAIILKSVQLSTVWWRNLQNFEVVNSFTCSVTFQGSTDEMSWTPRISVETRNDGLEYGIGINHNCEAFESGTGIMKGESSISYTISVNGDVESFIDSLAPDDGQFESMVKRTVLLLTAPVVIPTIPMQNLQSAIFNKRLSRRSSATADYETEAAFTVSTPSDSKTLRLAEEFRISRKNSFDSKLELTNDWDSLANIIGDRIRLGTKFDLKRQEGKVFLELFGEKYILNSKYDADGKCTKNRCDLDMREIQIEQNLPFLLAIGMPSKVDANAKCFLSFGKDEERFLATCDSSRLILGSIGDVDKEYSLSGFVKQSGKKVESDVTFIHNDEDLQIAAFGGSVPKKVHYFASGINDASICETGKTCLISMNTTSTIETSEDPFAPLEIFSTNQESLMITKSPKDAIFVKYHNFISEGKSWDIEFGQVESQNFKLIADASVSEGEDKTALSAVLESNGAWAKIHVETNDGESQKSLNAEYDFAYGTGRAYLVAKLHENVAMALQYSLVGDYVVGLYLENSPNDDLIWNIHDSSVQIDSDFFHQVGSSSNQSRCIHARINPTEIVFQHTNGHMVQDLNADWSLVPTKLHFNGLILEGEEFGNYTLSASLTEIQFMRNHNNAKYPFVFNYKVSSDRNPRLDVHLYHLEDLAIQSFDFSVNLWHLNSASVEFTNDDHLFNSTISVMLEMGTLFDFETTLDDNRFHLEINQPNFPEPSLGLGVIFYDDFDVLGWGETNFEGGVEFTKLSQLLVFSNLNGESKSFEMGPYANAKPGIFNVGLRMVQSYCDDMPASINVYFDSELAFRTGHFQIGVAYDDQSAVLIFSGEISDNSIDATFFENISELFGEPNNEIELQFGLKLASSSASTFSVFTTFVHRHDSDEISRKMAYIECQIPVFDGELATMIKFGLVSQGHSHESYGLRLSTDFPRTLFLEFISDHLENQELLSFDYSKLYAKVGDYEIERTEEGALIIRLSDGSFVEINAKLLSNGMKITTSVSDDYSGPLEELNFSIITIADSTSSKTVVIVNDESYTASINVGNGSIRLKFEQDGSSHFIHESSLQIVNESNQVGIEGMIDNQPFHFLVDFDTSIGLDGHIIASFSFNYNVEKYGTLGPKDGSFKTTWDITNPASSFNIQSEIAVGNFEKFLKASGIIKSARSFDFSVDHNIEIVPIPSFEIAFDNNNADHHLLLEIDSDKLEITISQSKNAFSISLPGRNQPIELFAISWSLDPVRSFEMKLNDNRLSTTLNKFSANQNLELDVTTEINFPALQVSHVSFSSVVATTPGGARGQISRISDGIHYNGEFEFENKDTVELTITHNDTILSALYIPEELEISGNMKGSKGYLSLDKFVINGKEVNAKAQLIMHPFQFEMSSKPIKIQAKFDQSKWFIRVATDGSIPNMEYTKLAFTRDQSEYILRVTDQSDEVKAIKVNLEFGNFEFSNKIVSSLPEQVTLTYNENSLAFAYASEISLNFNVTGEYTGNSVSFVVHEAHGKAGQQLTTNHVVGSVLTSVEKFHDGIIFTKLQIGFDVESGHEGDVNHKFIQAGWNLDERRHKSEFEIGYKTNFDFNIAQEFEIKFETDSNDKETVHSLTFKVDDFEKEFSLARVYVNNDDVMELKITIAEREENWKIAEISFEKDEISHLKFFVDQLILCDVEVGPKSARIETDRFGTLQINYDTQFVAQLSLNFGVIVNEKEYFALKTEADDNSSYFFLQILDTVHILDIETGFKNGRPNEEFEIKHCKMESSQIVENNDWYIKCRGKNIQERFSIIPTGILHPWLAHRAEFYSNGETTELWSLNFIQEKGDLQFKIWLYIAEAKIHLSWDGMTSDCERCNFILNADITGDSFETITFETDHTFQKESPRIMSEIAIQSEGYVYLFEQMIVSHVKDFYTEIEVSTQIDNGQLMTSSLIVKETETDIGLSKFSYTLTNNNFYQPWILEHVIGGETIFIKLDTQMTSEFGFSSDIDCDLSHDRHAKKKCVLNTWIRDSREYPEYDSKLKTVLETSTEKIFFHIQDETEANSPFDWFQADIAARGGNLTSITMKGLRHRIKDLLVAEIHFYADFSDITTIHIYQTETIDQSPIGEIFFFSGKGHFFEMKVLPIPELMELTLGLNLPSEFINPEKNQVYKIEYGNDVIKIEHWNGLASITIDNGYMAYIYQIKIISPTFKNNPHWNLRMIPIRQILLLDSSSDENSLILTVHLPEEYPTGIESFAGRNLEIFNLKSTSHQIESKMGIELYDFSKGSYKFYSKYQQGETEFDFEQSFEHGLIKASVAVKHENIENGNGNFNLRYGQDDENVTKAIAELNYDFDFNSLVGGDDVALKPAIHALTVSYANVGSFTNLNIESNNNFDKNSDNGLMNMFNGDIEWEMPDGVFDVKAKAQNDFKAPDMEYTTSVFTTNIQSNSYETRLNSGLDVGTDMIYQTESVMVTEENHADWKFEIRTINDHFFKTNFVLDIDNTEDFVQSAFEVVIGAQLDNNLPVGFKLSKEHLAESGRVLDLDLKLGDFTDEIHTAQVFVENDSNSAMLVAIIDEKRASIGIEDIDNTDWSEDSFNKGIKLFVELPFVEELESLNHRVGVVMKYDIFNYEAFSLELENVFISSVEINEEHFQIEFENKLETVLPVGNVKVAWVNNEQLRITFHNQEFHHEFGIMVKPQSHLSLSHVSTTEASSDTLQVYLYWNNALELVVIRNGEQKTYKLETDSVVDFFEKLEDLKPIFQGSWNKNDKRGVYSMGFEFDGARYIIQVELAQFEKSIQFNIRYEKPEARNEFVTVLTLEAGLGEKHQLEFFVEYHDGLRQLLDFEPVAVMKKAEYWLEQFFNNVVKFVETVAGNEVNADSIDTEMLDEIKKCLKNIIKNIEATNPKAAISNEPFTVWEVISGLMNLEKINLDESLQEARDYISNQITNAADKMLTEQEDALRYGSAIERQFFKVYKKVVMALANQTAEQVLQMVNLLSTKPSSYVVVEDNKIYVTVPLPDYRIPGYSKSVVDTISEADIEGNFWQAIAALNPSKRIANESLGFLEVEAEVVNGKFVRQFDGKWIVLNDESYDIFQDISEKHQNLMNVQGDASSRMLIKIGPEARNLEFGIFGVPDSEVFSDNIDHLSVKTSQLDDARFPDTTPEYDSYWVNSDSSSRPCHSVIDNYPYQKMFSGSHGSFCNAAFAYVRRCNNSGATISMPTLCNSVM